MEAGSPKMSVGGSLEVAVKGRQTYGPMTVLGIGGVVVWVGALVRACDLSVFGSQPQAVSPVGLSCPTCGRGSEHVVVGTAVYAVATGPE